MKTSKRISALLLAVCLVLGMLVPAVSAETTAAIETVTYDFDLMGLVRGKFSASLSSTSLTAETCISDISVLYDGDGKLSKGFKVEEPYLNWYYHSSDSVASNFSVIGDVGDCEGYFRITPDKKSLGSWVAFNIDNPGTGTWDISVTTPLSNRGARAVNVYILPGTETDIATATTHDDTGYDQYCIGNYNCYRALASGESDDKATPALSIITSYSVGTWVQNDDQASGFILVIKAVTANGNKNYVYSLLEELTMTKTSNDAEADLNDAILGSQITLNSNLALTGAVTTEADIVLDPNVSLDLAGKDLTAKSVNTAAPGAKVIDSADGVGLLNATLTADGDNGGYLPLYDAAGYRLL